MESSGSVAGDSVCNDLSVMDDREAYLSPVLRVTATLCCAVQEFDQQLEYEMWSWVLIDNYKCQLVHLHI
jgi:hypothetical protein